MPCYYPSATHWAGIDPAAAGFDQHKLDAAIGFICHEAETPWPVDLGAGLNSGGDEIEPPPWNEVIGPTRPRGSPNGLLLKNGKIVAEWGDTGRVDMTFSIAKSYLAVLTGIALERKLIGAVDDPVRDSVIDAGFEHPHNRTITWRHLLQQTSEWQGSLWDKPDLIDHHRQVGNNADNTRKGTPRTLQPPGEFWEYNDVRVNRLAFSLMQVFRQPLPAVLKTAIMAPIDASADWRWHGYRNSYYEIGGTVIQSVPGGSHWGGGLWISSRDHARFALLIAQQGRWRERQLIAPDWIEQMITPCPLNRLYGFLWWLNTGRLLYPSAPESSVFAIGAGSNIIWLEPVHDLVLVTRWIDPRQVDTLCTAIMASITD